MFVSKDCCSNNLYGKPGLLSFFEYVHLKENVDIGSCPVLLE